MINFGANPMQGMGAPGLGAPGMGGSQNQMAMMMQTMQMVMQVLSMFMGGGMGGGGLPMAGNFGGGGGDSGLTNFLGASPGVGGGGGYGGGGASYTDSAGSMAPSNYTHTGPVGPGVEGALAKANSMIGLNGDRDTAALQEVTGQSGINPSTTPWCAAFAMNILEDSGVMNLDGLENRNYCPSIVDWAKKKGTWGERGSYQPKPGDAILFDWGGDGTSDHIGIVERVENGKVITIEGNSGNAVKRNTYDLNSGNIMGYAIGGQGGMPQGGQQGGAPGGQQQQPQPM